LAALGGPVVVLAGHLHVRGHAISGNVLQLSQAALAESPHDAALITVELREDRIDITRQCHSLGHSLATVEGAVPAVLDPARIAFSWDGTAWRDVDMAPRDLVADKAKERDQ
jgi:hypothetical protein